MRAVVVQEDKTVKVEDKPVPKIGPNEILIKVIAAGLNPTDWKGVQKRASPGAIVGCDAVGEVILLGSDVPPSEVKKGEIRWLFVMGAASPENGAFAEYVRTPWDVTSVVPSNVSPHQAASFPVPLSTDVLALYGQLKIPQYPEQAPKDTWIVIWGGASATGQYAIQLAKLSGLKVATTASTHRWDLLRGLGADVVVDYKDPDVVAKLKEATNDSISLGYDCISEGGTIQKTQEAFQPSGGKLITTLFDLSNLPRPEVQTEYVLAPLTLGLPVQFGPIEVPANPDAKAIYVKWCNLLPSLFADGKLLPIDIEILDGLESVAKGMELLKTGKATKKIVFSIA
ncbi:GroES-like protein [Sistotremastrum suecicum HHB10207 ss-3]|uniref:GroES-like protein n=1 Tax=Sistotremastrum suecicum HHB10207 ss-3 TaxID=1314776 RepID=A0A165XWY2_9AGAM|nr:GroES-like protein [Sistotremastrum suecicum HHB10207 ss-3]